MAKMMKSLAQRMKRLYIKVKKMLKMGEPEEDSSVIADPHEAMILEAALRLRDHDFEQNLGGMVLEVSDRRAH